MCILSNNQIIVKKQIIIFNHFQIFCFVVVISQRSDLYHSSPNSVAMLNFINTLPDGLIVMMAAWDTGSVCRAGCQKAMELVGGSGIPNGHRGNFLTQLTKV